MSNTADDMYAKLQSKYGGAKQSADYYDAYKLAHVNLSQADQLVQVRSELTRIGQVWGASDHYADLLGKFWSTVAVGQL